MVSFFRAASGWGLVFGAFGVSGFGLRCLFKKAWSLLGTKQGNRKPDLGFHVSLV